LPKAKDIRQKAMFFFKRKGRKKRFAMFRDYRCFSLQEKRLRRKVLAKGKHY